MTTKIPAVLQESLGWTIYRVSLLMRRVLMEVLDKYGLTPEQWQVLAAVWETDQPRTQSELAEITVKDRHTLSRMLTRMEQNGWIKRQAHPDDDRAYLVSATKKALSHRDTMPAEIKKQFKPIWAALSDKEHKQLLENLHILREKMES